MSILTRLFRKKKQVEETAKSVYDIVFHGETEIHALIEKAIINGEDPVQRFRKLLESVDLMWTEKWRAIYQAAFHQYCISKFIKRLADMQSKEFELPVKVIGITYGWAITRSLEELADELKQINGLLGEMPSPCPLAEQQGVQMPPPDEVTFPSWTPGQWKDQNLGPGSKEQSDDE